MAVDDCLLFLTLPLPRSSWRDGRISIVSSEPRSAPGKPHEASYPTLSPDTDPAAEAVQLAIYRDMPAWRKLQLIDDAIRTSRSLALAGLRKRHPEAGSEELRRRFMDLWLGEELAARAYGPVK